MKRQKYTATLIDAGEVIATAEGFAMNSTITKSEGLVRTRARELGTVFEGMRPIREGQDYHRTWIGYDYGVVTVMVTPAEVKA